MKNPVTVNCIRVLEKILTRLHRLIGHTLLKLRRIRVSRDRSEIVPYLTFSGGNPPSTFTQHLEKEFGSYQVCGGVPVCPPQGARIQITKRLQTCHPTSGRNLDGDNCIPRGHYQMGKAMLSELGNSCFCTLTSLDDNAQVYFRMGFLPIDEGTPKFLLDWKIAKRG